MLALRGERHPDGVGGDEGEGEPGDERQADGEGQALDTGIGLIGMVQREVSWAWGEVHGPYRHPAPAAMTVTG